MKVFNDLVSVACLQAEFKAFTNGIFRTSGSKHIIKVFNDLVSVACLQAEFKAFTNMALH